MNTPPYSIRKASRRGGYFSLLWYNSKNWAGNHQKKINLVQPGPFFLFLLDCWIINYRPNAFFRYTKKSTSNFQHFMETNLLRPWKLTWNLKRMVSKISFSRGPFSGSMLVFGEVTPKSPNVGFGGEKCWGTRTGHRRHFPRPIAGGIASNLTHQLPTTLNVGLAKPWV